MKKKRWMVKVGLVNEIDTDRAVINFLTQMAKCGLARTADSGVSEITEFDVPQPADYDNGEAWAVSFANALRANGFTAAVCRDFRYD